MNLLFVAGGGAIGALMRYWLSYALIGFGAPWNTFIINTAGCFAIGISYIWLHQHLSSHNDAFRLFVMVGLLGGFTTFSAFSLEVLLLIENGQWSKSFLYVFVTLSLCLIMSFAGLRLGQLIFVNS